MTSFNPLYLDQTGVWYTREYIDNFLSTSWKNIWLTLMLLANLANTKWWKKNFLIMIVTLTHGYSSKSTQQQLSNEYQKDRVSMFFKKLWVLVFWTKVASVLEGLKVIVPVGINFPFSKYNVHSIWWVMPNFFIDWVQPETNELTVS